MVAQRRRYLILGTFLLLTGCVGPGYVTSGYDNSHSYGYRPQSYQQPHYQRGPDHPRVQYRGYGRSPSIRCPDGTFNSCYESQAGANK